MIHALKCEPEFFQAVTAGTKRFEVRDNDRGFKIGDYIGLNELTDDRQGYTGRSFLGEITYILDDGRFLAPGYVVLGFRKVVTIDEINTPFFPLKELTVDPQVVGTVAHS